MLAERFTCTRVWRRHRKPVRNPRGAATSNANQLSVLTTPPSHPFVASECAIRRHSSSFSCDLSHTVCLARSRALKSQTLRLPPPRIGLFIAQSYSAPFEAWLPLLTPVRRLQMALQVRRGLLVRVTLRCLLCRSVWAALSSVPQTRNKCNMFCLQM